MYGKKDRDMENMFVLMEKMFVSAEGELPEIAAGGLGREEGWPRPPESQAARRVGPEDSSPRNIWRGIVPTKVRVGRGLESPKCLARDRPPETSGEGSSLRNDGRGLVPP